MNRINNKVVLVCLLCVLVLAATSASMMATQPTIAPPQSLSAATPPAPAIVKGTLIGGQLLTTQLVHVTMSDAPAIVLSPWSSFDLAINGGRLAHFSH